MSLSTVFVTRSPKVPSRCFPRLFGKVFCTLQGWGHAALSLFGYLGFPCLELPRFSRVNFSNSLNPVFVDVARQPASSRPFPRSPLVCFFSPRTFFGFSFIIQSFPGSFLFLFCRFFFDPHPCSFRVSLSRLARGNWPRIPFWLPPPLTLGPIASGKVPHPQPSPLMRLSPRLFEGGLRALRVGPPPLILQSPPPLSRS